MNDADRSVAYLPFLREVPLFATLSEEPARFIAGGSQMRTFERDLVLCEKGSRTPGLFCLLSGRVKLSVLAPDGGERVVDLVMPGRVFGQAAAVLDEPYPLLAQVLSDSQVLLVGRERLREAMARWPDAAALLLRAMAEDCFRLVRDLECCCLMSAPRRLMDFLVTEAEAANDAGDDRVELVLPAAKAVIASRLNLTAETFSRELHELAHRGLLEVERRTVRIHSLTRLREAMEPCASAVRAARVPAGAMAS